jgi:glycine oxidase
VKHWDVIVIGAGAIGLSLALRLRDEHRSVLIVEKHEPATEATYAAGGMIANCDPHTPAALQPLADQSAALYPDFVREIEVESGESADLRDAGTIAVFAEDEVPSCEGSRQLSAADLNRLEPSLHLDGTTWYLPERSVDPRRLGRALVKACKKRAVDFATGSEVLEVLTAAGRAAGVRTTHSTYHAAAVVNCAGAWAAQIAPLAIPTRPVKGQMVCVVPQTSVGAPRIPAFGIRGSAIIRHVVRTPDIYIIPRSDGRILLGATVENAGFDKRTDPQTIQRLYKAGLHVAPVLSATRIHDAWAGLRPGSPDELPILGETSIPGYFAATGHYRDGIMLAPATAIVMAQLITGSQPSIDLALFSPLRFG